MGKQVDFFLGASSPGGFTSFFNELLNPISGLKSFIIKGGPGTGKSGMIHHAIQTLSEQESLIERIHCAADPSSLDGAVFHDNGCAVLDGTAPHVVEPKYPGTLESVVSLYDCCNDVLLEEKRNEIITAFTQKEVCQVRTQNFLHAANTLLQDSFYIALENTDTQKIHNFAKRICLCELARKTRDRPLEHKRILSAITADGVLTFFQTAQTLCERIYVIKDEYGCASRLLLSAIRSYALEYGHEIYTCYCPLNPYDKIEHLFLPELGLGFVTQHRFNNPDFVPYRVVNFTRFTDMDAMKLKKQRLSFNRKAAADLLGEAVLLMGTARACHLHLEKCYQQATDFEIVNRRTELLCKRLLQIGKP